MRPCQAPNADGILAFYFEPTDDGKTVEADFIGRDRSALRALFADRSITVFEQGEGKDRSGGGFLARSVRTGDVTEDLFRRRFSASLFGLGARWSSAGAATASANGVSASDASGAALISRVPIPDGSADGEIRMQLALIGSGGSYTALLRASADAKPGGGGGGTYLAFEMQNPVNKDGTCSANFTVLESVAGSVSLLAAFPHGCHDGMEMRMVARGDVLLVSLDEETPLEFAIDRMPHRIGAGQPGVGIRSAPPGNGIVQVQLGLAGRTGPPQPDRQKIRASAFPNHIDLQWTAVPASASAPDLLGYLIYRDGAYLGRTRAAQFQDETVAPNGNYSYAIHAVDRHGNVSPPSVVTATAPAWPTVPARTPGPTAATPGVRPRAASAPAPLGPTTGFDPRRVGIQSTGAYWGGAGEQIDLISGNLNFSVPVVTAKSRGGWSIPFQLNYNSQMWRRDANGEWLFGQDVGYGLGWKLLAGAVTPVWSGGQISYYLFTDSTGAEYRLDRNNGNVWTSVQGIYLAYDANTNQLRFPDGTFWILGCQSSGGEADAGTLYPTILEDTNGNYVTVSYAWGAGAGSGNSSARITTILDSRTNSSYFPVYTFTYNAQGRLWGIDSMQGLETYRFTYTSQPLVSPLTGASYGTVTVLQAAEATGFGAATQFQYANTGEMTQMTTPLGGVLQWTHRSFTYGTGITIREVQNRYMPMYPGAGWWFWHDDATDATQPFHGITQIGDETGSKPYWFGTSPAGNLVVPYWQSERTPDNTADYNMRGWGWTQDAAGNVYVNSTTKWVNPSWPASGYWSTAWPRTLTTQTVDTHGNLVQQQVYDFGASSPTRTYNFSYLSDTNHTSRFIYNRLTLATVTDASGTHNLVSNQYDWGVSPAMAPFHDPSYGTGMPYRGNLAQTTVPSGTTMYYYLETGVISHWQNAAGMVISNTTNGSTNYSLPATITPNGDTNQAISLSYATSWAVVAVTGANGTNATVNYDNYGRPTSSKIPDGATTTYTYTLNPSTQTATLGTRWTRTTLDGFGRTVKVETGTGGSILSVAETEYAPCGCSPLGKMFRTSRPHALGASPIWTTYAYDGTGRTVSVTLPDASVTRTEYTANTVKVTDAAGKWKKQTTDAFGNLKIVTEPNPAGGADWTTSYSYDWTNHLTGVEMPRPYNGGSYTQVRTFTWNGDDLTSETNPETGTITYNYDINHRLVSRTDAKNQRRGYIYDGFGRVTARTYSRWVTKYNEWGQPYHEWEEQEAQRVNYHYDSNPLDPAFSQNSWGRLTWVEFGNEAGGPERFSYQYSYNQAGRITNQRMQITSGVTAYNLDAAYGWDNEGRMTSLTGPSDGPVQTFSYDSMGRLSSGGATYGPAGELLTFNGVTRTYNALGQLTRMTKAGVMDVEYRYIAGQNNGRIWQSKDYVTGEEVTYQYDSLNRLGRAETTDASWGNAYTYDGWGNLTGKSQTKGVAPTLSKTYDPALNMPTGSNPPSYVPYWYDQQWDMEDRPLDGSPEMWRNWQGQWWSGRVSYDPSGKKVFWRGKVDDTIGAWIGCEIYFHGITGQRLARYQCNDDWGTENQGAFGLSLTDRTQHIGGQLTTQNGKSVTTDRMGSVRARDGERYTYFPYGEPRTATVSGGGTYAGLESPLRMYDSTTGRFDRPDPLGLQAVKMGDPGSWNRFAYVQGDPVNYNDPEGLTKCGDLEILGTGDTLRDAVTAHTDLGLLANLVWAESDHTWSRQGTPGYYNEQDAVAWSVVNRWKILNGYLSVDGVADPATLGWGRDGATISEIIGRPGQYSTMTSGGRGGTRLRSDLQATLNDVLDGEPTRGDSLSVDLGSLGIVTMTHECYDVWQSWVAATFAITGVSSDPFASQGYTTSFHHGTATTPLEGRFGNFGSANNFFGISKGAITANPTPVAPPVRRRRPGR